MIKLLSPLFLLTLLTIVISCTTDNAQEYYGGIECDSINVTFSATIDPILERNCKGCHFNGNGTGVTLVSYDDIKKAADNGRLLGTIKHLPGYSPMPQDGTLDDCSISKVESWVNNGAPNH